MTLSLGRYLVGLVEPPRYVSLRRFPHLGDRILDKSSPTIFIGQRGAASESARLPERAEAGRRPELARTAVAMRAHLAAWLMMRPRNFR